MGGRSVGPHRRRGRHRARRGDGRDRSGRDHRRPRPRAVAAARPPLGGDRAAAGAGASSCRAGSGMIRYSLTCERKHDFEIWFKNSADYDKQAKRGLVTCPACGSAEVEKALMAPALGRGTNKDVHVAVAEAPPTTEAPVPVEDKTPVAMRSPQEQERRA